MKSFAVLLLLVGFALIGWGVYPYFDKRNDPPPTPNPTPTPVNSGCVKANNEITSRYSPITRRGEIVDWRPIPYATPIPAGHYGMIADLSQPSETQGTRREFYKIVWASEADPYLVRNPKMARNQHWILTDLVTPADCRSIPGPPPSPTPTPGPTVETEAWSLPALGASVESLRFFEGSEATPGVDQRTYINTFARSTTRHIYWELKLTHPTREKREYFTIEEIWYGPDGVTFGQNKWQSFIEPSWPASLHARSFGFSAPGHWRTGTYKVELSVGKEVVATGTFNVLPH